MFVIAKLNDPLPLKVYRFLKLTAEGARLIRKIKKALKVNQGFYILFVPGTGFEPAHPFGHHHLKVACLPISTPGQ